MAARKDVLLSPSLSDGRKGLTKPDCEAGC